MKEVYGSTWTLQLMIGFILLFMAFLTLMISFSRVAKIKNEVLTIIEKYNGVNNTSIKLVNSYLNASGYNITGRCENTGEMRAVNNLSDNSIVNPSSGEKYYYCIEKEANSRDNIITTINYEITLFYKFDIPILGDIATFTVKGKTIDLIDRDSNLL